MMSWYQMIDVNSLAREFNGKIDWGAYAKVGRPIENVIRFHVAFYIQNEIWEQLYRGAKNEA